MKRKLMVTLTLAAVALTGCALTTRTSPLAVGVTAPDFELPDTEGKTWKLSDMLATGPAVVIFYRGYW